MAMPDIASDTTAMPIPFEKGLERLEALVKRMESSQLTLADTMTTYGEGMRLAKSLDEQLNQTEQQLTILSLDREDGMEATS